MCSGSGKIGLWCVGHESQEAEKNPRDASLSLGLPFGITTWHTKERGVARRVRRQESKSAELQECHKAAGDNRPDHALGWGFSVLEPGSLRSGKIKRCELTGFWLDVPCISGEPVVLDCRRRRDVSLGRGVQCRPGRRSVPCCKVQTLLLPAPARLDQGPPAGGGQWPTGQMAPPPGNNHDDMSRPIVSCFSVTRLHR